MLGFAVGMTGRKEGFWGPRTVPFQGFSRTMQHLLSFTTSSKIHIAAPMQSFYPYEKNILQVLPGNIVKRQIPESYTENLF